MLSHNFLCSATIFSTEAQKTQILITLERGQSMLNFEENLQQSLNGAGQLACSQQLEYLDTDGSPMTVALGLDGANLRYYEGFRIAMCGTITR